MANTHLMAGTISAHRNLIKSYETSAANTALTVSTPTARKRILKVLYVLVSYSTSVSKNITVTLNSALGAGYDNLITTIALSSAADGKWYPDEELIISPVDTIDAVAAAGGAGVTSSVTIVCLEM